MTRTFPKNPFYKQEHIRKSIEQLLRAWVWRNPHIGYQQGMNFIVGRLRKYLEEEETFWAFAMIIESYLPLDYFE